MLSDMLPGHVLTKVQYMMRIKHWCWPTQWTLSTNQTLIAI